MKDSRPIAIVGLGYVGLPLALHFAEAGASVLGLDVDVTKVERLNAGASYILHLPSARVASVVQSGRLTASADFSRVAGCQAVIICVPTPLKGSAVDPDSENAREPDLSYILNTGRAIAPHLRPGGLVVLESTTYPGTTDTELRAVLEEGSGLRAGLDFHLAYSPEREDPGNPASRVAEIPKVVGGLTPACRDRALALYGLAIRHLVPVAVKLTENIFRAVNIAMVNELKVVYAAMGIDIWAVIEAARTKPFGFMPFYPGPGLGGHCIPIDPFYLTWKAKQYGQATRFIELAGEINTAMPQYVVRRCSEALATRGKTLDAARILLLGVAYKPDVDDDRESPAYVLWKRLESAGATVEYHDPHVPVIRPSREHGEFSGRRRVELTDAVVAAYDLVLLVTHHRALDYALLARSAALLVDTRNAFASYDLPAERYFKA
jgi:UDP-N-acetyl-D-glucosamine dehydrogenase